MKINIPDKNIPRIVIIGGGFGGIELAKQLNGLDVQIVLIDRHNYHTFQPLLYQVATGGLEPDSIAFPLRRLFRKQDNLSFRMAEVMKIIPEKNLIITSIGQLSYDYLILATGSKTNYYNIKSAEENSIPMKTIPQALDIRSLILQNFEESLLTTDLEKRELLMNFVIVGGGPTGVEMAGTLGELKNHILPGDYPELDFRRMQIHLLEAMPHLLSGMSLKASKKACKFLKDLGVNVWLNAAVSSFNGKEVKFSPGKEIPASTLIWTAGVMGDIIEGFDNKVIVRGNRIKVDEYNKIKGYENIFAIGDVASMSSKQFPNGFPMLAPVAVQQGRLLAQNIRRIVRGEKPEPFRYKNRGIMATVGRNKAVVDLPHLKFQGFLAWFAWMFVHLMSLVNFRNRVIVFVSWVWNYFTYDKALRLIIRPYRKSSGLTENIPYIKTPSIIS